jgi:hypothetical protein
MNTLYFGDNLEVLRDSITDASVGLVYLDPPFNSGANYNIIFQPEKKSAADLFKEYLLLQLPPEEVRNGRKMTIIAEPGADEAKDGLFDEQTETLPCFEAVLEVVQQDERAAVLRVAGGVHQCERTTAGYLRQ